MSFLIAGLGNLGPEYELTRHNAGFLIADKLADRHKTTFEVSRYAFYTKIKFRGKNIHLIKPTTYMNLSGKAVMFWLKELKIPEHNLLVVVDDMALPFGQLRIKHQGSSAGHNGLNHIEEVLGTRIYSRLRFGIGDHFHKGRQVEYVLSRFSADEFKSLDLHLDLACDMIESFVLVGVTKTMNLYNKKAT